MTSWYCEELHSKVQQRLYVDKLLYRGRTDYQEIEIFENPLLGRVLVLDNIVQTTERDEFVYHEMLTHLPILAHGAVRKVLIIGGGDGGILEEVLKHPVETVTMVELDPKVVALCREYLSSISGDAFDDPRCDLIFADGAAFVAEDERRYDLVVVDSPDPIGPAKVLFESPFYAGCRRCLADGGILVTQNGVPFFQSEEVTSTHASLKRLFAHTDFYVAPVPTYIGGHMTFGWASDGGDIRAVDRDTVAERYARSGLTTRYYNPDVHVAAFAIPNYIRELMV